MPSFETLREELALHLGIHIDPPRSTPVSKRIRFIYDRGNGSPTHRGFEPTATIVYILEHGTYRDKPLAYIRWSSGNYDFKLKRPRVQALAGDFAEQWYRAAFESVDSDQVQSQP